MSDLWPFSSSPPIIHHSSLSSPFTSSPPRLSSPLSPRNHGNQPHAKTPSYHLLPQAQVTSHLPHSQVTSPHFPPPQVTSPHSQVTSPHFPPVQVTSPHSQVTSPHFPPPQVTSPHFPPPQVTSPHSQVTSPHSQVTSPHFPPVQVTSPHFPPPQVTSPHFPPAQVTSQYHPHSQSQIISHHLFSNQNQDPGSDNPNWSRAEPPPELSVLLKSYSYSHQNQSTAHLDLQLQNQNQYSTGVTHHGDELENTLTLHTSGVYRQGDTPGPVQDTWRSLGPTLSQLQCSPLGSTPGEVTLGSWSSDFISSPVGNSSSTQFFLDGCYDNNAPQPFCSPNTPGLSPHYPQTPTISSPGHQTHPREDRLDFHTQPSRQLSRDEALSCCLHEHDSYTVTSDPGQPHPHQTSQHLLQSQSTLIQDKTGLLQTSGGSNNCFSPQGRGQDVSCSAQSPGPSAGQSWREVYRGGGRRGRRGRGDVQPDWTLIKQPQTKKSTEDPDCRLQCTVCKRDFRSLPALNGHMRSHSSSRAATWLNKGEDSSQNAVSMVMPVSVPIQSRERTNMCVSGQRRCSRPSAATGGTVLYRSLLHLEEDKEEAVAKGDSVVTSGGDDNEAAASCDAAVAGGDGGSGVHYTPSPMLCPLRAGPGLFCSLTSRRQQRVQTVQLHNAYNGLHDLVTMETASTPLGMLSTGITKPRINVGRGFQAEIPPLRSRRYAHSDSHNALSMWTPWEELEHPANQQRVEALLMMARSGVVPGGGASPESALHLLSECRGDFLLTVEKLLSAPETSDHTGVSWSPAESRMLLKSLQLHQKDFSRVQKDVQTKTISQCVEFYYLWKKKLSLSARTLAGLTVTLPDRNGQRSSRLHDAS